VTDEAIKPMFLDIVTGKTVAVDQYMSGFDLWWWSEGNGSCDCNRELLFKPDAECDGVCLGAHRYVAVDVDIADADAKADAIELMNSSYPDEARKVARERVKR
jgi:hypothetical protein